MPTPAHTLARRSGVGRTSPPLDLLRHEVEITSPDGACFGVYANGGTTFVEDSDEIVSLTHGTFAFANRNWTSRGARLDTPDARDFRDDFVTLP